MHERILVNSVRVRWGLCSSLPVGPSSFHRRGAFALRPPPGVRGFPTCRLLRPLRHCLRHRGCVGGSLPSCPLPFASCRKLPVFVREDSSGMMEVACASLPLPRSAASQSASRGGQGDLYGPGTGDQCLGPYACLAPTMLGVTGWHLRHGMPGARFPVGLCPLQVLHPLMPQPSHHLWRAGLPRMVPFRAMRLTS
jgi:hypothetical protein